MKLMLGTKQYMTQVFSDDGRVHPATVLSVTPNTVLMNKTAEKDGYTAIQLGAVAKKEKHTTKPLQGHFRKAGETMFRYVKEDRLDGDADAAVGTIISVGDVFQAGDSVTVSGVSKAKGFQGVIKRHGFSGGPRSHGQAHSERAPGSIGGGLRRRVPKNMRMGGRTGGVRVTVSNLTVLAVDTEANTLTLSGAVPGRRGTLLEIRKVQSK